MISCYKKTNHFLHLYLVYDGSLFNKKKKKTAGSEGRFGYVSILYQGSSICVNDGCEC